MENLKLMKNGEVAVTVVRIKKALYKTPYVDLCDYESPNITAIIPCWQAKDGSLRSIKTDMPVKVGEYDQVRTVLLGSCFKYPDGEELIFTRNGLGEKFFTRRDANVLCNLYRAFGE